MLSVEQLQQIHLFFQIPNCVSTVRKKVQDLLYITIKTESPDGVESTLSLPTVINISFASPQFHIMKKLNL